MSKVSSSTNDAVSRENYANKLVAAGAEIDSARRKILDQKKEEIAKVEQNAKMREMDIARASEEKVRDIREGNDKKILDATVYKEDRLQDVKKSLEETTAVIEREKKQQQMINDQQRDEGQLSFERRINQLNNEHTLKVTDENDKLKEDLRSINVKSKLELDQSLHKIKSDKHKVQAMQDSKLEMEARTFNDQVFMNDLQNNINLKNQKTRFNNEFETKEATHNQKFAQQDIRHRNETDSSRRMQDQTMLSSKVDFDHKYKVLLAEQSKNLKDFNDRVNLSMEKIKEKEQEFKIRYANLAQDPFYKGINLEPRISEDQKNYHIKFDIPKFEAEHANLSGKDRRLKFSFSRMADNEFKSLDGTQNKTKRAESITREFDVAEIINPKKITREIKDYEVIFTVPKA